MEETPTTTTQGVDTPPAVNESKEAQAKSFTQDDVDRIIQERLERERKQAKTREQEAISQALAEAERQSKLSAEERAAESTKKREQALIEREQAVALKENRVEATTMLQAQGISIELVDFIVDVDPAKTAENVKVLTKAYKKAVEQGIVEGLKGSSPKETPQRTVQSLQPTTMRGKVAI